MKSLTQALAPILALALLPSLASAKPDVLGARTLVDNGDPSNRYDIVFVGDGYRREDQEDYQRTVTRAVEALKATSPFREYWGYLNIHRLDVASRDHGHSMKGGEQKDTAFDSSYGHRFRYVKGDTRAIKRAVARHAPDADAIVCLVADGWGGVSYGKVCFVGGDSPKTSVHELGHTIARLADEYDMYEVKLPKALITVGEVLARPVLRLAGWRFDNVSRLRSRGSIPWRHWVEPDTPLPTPSHVDEVGLHEGAFYTSKGMYRPQATCLMRHGDDPCAVCKERLTISISEKVIPYAWTHERTQEGVRLGFRTIVPGRVKARWFVSGDQVSEDSQAILVRSRKKLRVRLEVADATPFVRKDSDEVLLHSHDWHLKKHEVRKERTNQHESWSVFGLFSANRLEGDWTRHLLLESVRQDARPAPEPLRPELVTRRGMSDLVRR